MCIFGISSEGAALTSECDCFQPACGCHPPQCRTAHGACLKQDRVGPGYEEFFETGDPCFYSTEYEENVGHFRVLRKRFK